MAQGQHHDEMEKRLTDFMEFQAAALLRKTEESQTRLLSTIEGRKEKQAEIAALKESISQRQEQKQKLTEELEALKPICEKRKEEARRNLAKAEQALKKSEKKLNKKKESKDKLQASADKAKRLIEAIKRDDGQLVTWLSSHFIHMHVDDTGNGETVIQLLNLDPQKPEFRFHILLESILPDANHFTVKNIYPEFENAYSVIHKANESKDFLQLLKDCKRHWQQELRRTD